MCPICGEQSTEGQSFCGKCGASLGSVVSEQVEPAPLVETPKSNPAAPRSSQRLLLGSAVALVALVLIGLLTFLPSGGRRQPHKSAASSPTVNSPEDQCVSDASSAVGTMFHDWISNNGANQDLASYAATYGTSSDTFAAIQAGFTVLADGAFRKGLAEATKEAVPKIQTACGLAVTTTMPQTTSPPRTTTTVLATRPVSQAEENHHFYWTDTTPDTLTIRGIESAVAIAFARGKISGGCDGCSPTYPNSGSYVFVDSPTAGAQVNPVPGITVHCETRDKKIVKYTEIGCSISGPAYEKNQQARTDYVIVQIVQLDNKNYLEFAIATGLGYPIFCSDLTPNQRQVPVVKCN